jgi:hypothetical protein
VLRHFPAQVVVEIPSGQSSEEIPRQLAVAVFGCQATKRFPNLLGCRREQRRQRTPDDRRQALGGGLLCQLAEIGAAAGARRMPVDGLGNSADEVQQSWFRVDPQPLNRGGRPRN